MTKKIYPVVLCGGSGTRLWPLSREEYPKQLLTLVNGNTLLQATIQRLHVSDTTKDDVEIATPIVITNESHRFLVAEQLREIGIKDAQIILEPVGKNTAPALCLAALHIQQIDPEGLMLVMPADHVIQNQPLFLEAIISGLHYTNENCLVTFGIVPSHAETGYGYIKQAKELQKNIYRINSFVEKPDSITAETYVASGDYVWNSGLFLFSAKTWLNAIKHFRQDIFEATQAAYENKASDLDFIRVNSELFKACPSESIDYAVMEHVTDDEKSNSFSGAVVALDAGWSDVGSWDSLWNISDKDSNGNVIKGDVFLDETKNSMVIADGRMVSVIGLSDVIVVETADAIMVAEKTASQSVKRIVKQLADKNRQEIITHSKVSRPWGHYESIDNGARYQAKRIVVNPNARLSLQKHHHRAEHWIVVTGTAKVTKGDDVFLLSENQSTYIPLGIKHRLENPGTIPLEIIEVQSGSYLGEDDIVRYDDEYGRDS